MKKILVIEDDQKITSALAIRLKAHGYATWIAQDAIIGVKMAVQHKPDLILLDITLPGGDGFRLAEQLRELPETKDTQVIFLTASKDPALRQKVMDLGAAGLIEKPYDVEDLLVMIKYAFGRPARVCPDLFPSTASDFGKPLQQQKMNKILIVEDDRKIAMGLGVRLKAAGYEAILAFDALTGVNSAVKNQPDLVLLDISMPAGGGFSVAERIQTAIPTPTPIIFLTASKRPELREKAKELGAAGFFEKPFEPDELLATIKKTLASCRS